MEWIERVMATPVKRFIQSDGRIVLWGNIAEVEGRVLRVVLLEDGETVHNALVPGSRSVSKKGKNPNENSVLS